MPLVDQAYIDRVLSDRPSPGAASARPVGLTLLERASHLEPAEKLLAELAFKNHLSHRQIGQILSVPAGTITRRLQRICRRLRDPLILALIDPRGAAEALPEQTRALAVQHFLHRRSAAELARTYSRSEREISRELDFVRGWHRGITHARQRVAAARF
jgi:DNA-directed RNA polymerase specialized sigma24 family protein